MMKDKLSVYTEYTTAMQCNMICLALRNCPVKHLAIT